MHCWRQILANMFRQIAVSLFINAKIAYIFEFVVCLAQGHQQKSQPNGLLGVLQGVKS